MMIAMITNTMIVAGGSALIYLAGWREVPDAARVVAISRSLRDIYPVAIAEEFDPGLLEIIDDVDPRK